MLTLISSILLTTTTKPYGRATNQNGNTFYYVTNYRGDVVRMVDENGATVANYSYDPWGKVLSVSENAAVAGQPIGYAGYYYDRETKLYYLQARYYDPETARFLSRDPYPGDLDNPITQNGYTYANNNPVIYVDPDGELPWVVKEIAKFAIKQAVRNPKNLRIVVEKIRSFTKQKYIKKALDQLGLEVQSNLKGGYILKIMANRKRILSIDYHGLNIFKGTGKYKGKHTRH
ncbi:hypothetical protein B6A27_08365, partial [Anoxybacillus sp. UARK-01]|uniref:RHS repeat-associated core domain-containing protein n=1 Tax=Anoxybacillus sp. UARK-01 TaxID=1895648 RepID=UPI0009F12FC0